MFIQNDFIQKICKFFDIKFLKFLIYALDYYYNQNIKIYYLNLVIGVSQNY